MAKHEAHTPEPDDASRAAGGAGGAPTLDAHPMGFLGGGAHRGGAQEFVVLTDAEEPPEELAGARPVREAGSKRRWIAGGVAAGVLVAGFFVWTLPGSGALETQGGATWCTGAIPTTEDARTVEIYAAFKNFSSLPVTVTGAGAQQVDGVTIEKVEASVRTDAGGGGLARSDSFRQRDGAPPVAQLGAGRSVEVAPGKELLVVLTAKSLAGGSWSGQVSEVRVDYHSWTQAPHRSVDGSIMQFTTGKCPEV
ncbi:hypothetical protein DWB68_08520 [Galactobacter valiniphilus]|uniref:Uncharacterized protein n=1 Tax=Galactobacter valiniphilus TaxID=2676122 RepID=A0A399J9I2_9MICC|nr:hypothetical protein [Galactobacter valiniphilus]RII42261.1 hypothetical protein DWB68_08520 [Galactobacter valiniphilus]